MKSLGFYVRLILPTAHLCLCLGIQFAGVGTGGAWTWFPMFFVDFPFSILLLPLSNRSPFIAFAVGGTAWWYLISLLLFLLWTKVSSLVRKPERADLTEN